MAAPCAQAQNECSSAVPITLGDDVTLTETESGDHWYAVSAEEGKSYAVSWTNGWGSVRLHMICGDEGLYWNDVVTAPSTQTYFINAMGNDGYSFTITEVTGNRICANAQAIALDEVATLTTTDNTVYWYVITFEADKVYVIEWEAGSSGYFELYRTCGGNQIAFSNGKDLTYSPSAAGTYYVKAQGRSGGKFTVKEITLDANDNRICANAQTVTLGADITLATADQTHYWYKIELEADKMYELSRDGSGTARLFASCGSSESEVLAHFVGNTYTPTATSTYYIEAYSYSAGDKVKVVEVTDNRSCANAEELAPNAESPTLPKQYTNYWYKVELAAGTTYTIDWQNSGDGYFEVYTTCGGSRVNSNGSVYEITATSTYYIRAYSYNADGTFKIAEVTDNRVCAHADGIALNAESPTLPQQYNYYWYTVELTAGKVYAAEWLNSGNGFFEVYTTCGGSRVNSNGSVYEITATSTYYISAYSYNADGKFKIAEVTDNRVCANAEPLAPATESPALPKTNTYYWYKVDLEAGTPYLFETTGGNGYGELYTSCGGSYVASTSSPYTATESSTFYLSLRGNDADYKIKVSEITDNQVCAYAERINLATEITPPAASRDYYYKTTLEAGKDYELQWTEGTGSIYLSNSCGGNTLTGGNGTQVYSATATGTYYIRVRANAAAGKFKVNETTISATDNRLCANAKPLAVGTESDALPADVTYWYKLTLTAGKTYAVETTNGNTNYNLYTDDCSNTYVDISNITETGTYHLRVVSNAADSKFKVSEFTDNRACSNAVQIALDQEVTPSTQGTYYWYTINFTAGKTYNIQWTGSGYVVFYDACNGTQLGSSNNYVAPNSGTYYIRAQAYQADAAFKVTLTDAEVVTDNRLCTYATQVELGETITPTTTNTDYWYTVDFTAGKDYKFEGKEGGDIVFYLHNACGSAVLVSRNLWQTNLSELYSAKATGTYYVKVYAYQDGSTLKISEVTAPTVQSVQIVANNGMSVPKGGTQKFEARVTALGGAAQTVTWSMTGGTTGTSISADGTLTIGAAETATILVVTATSTADNSKKESKTVTVTTDVLVEAVLLVSVNPYTASVAKGSTQQFEVVVLVQGGAGKGIKWSVSDNSDAGTSISADGGLLTVAAAETASTLTVTATSTVDASQKSTARVTVTAAGGTGTETVTAQDTPLRPYPNPVTNGQLTIDNGQLEASDRIAIYNMNGGLMGVYKVSSGASTTLNIGHLPTGIYIVKAGKRTAKVVKQ
ncbi:hypothetical protein AGMMS49965_08320 [Bacteroidia bacterium]|nr:hypothetical protein AGMMS49965_08320 [Bacteroidia bacterium]